jgi:hypothetical protein
LYIIPQATAGPPIVERRFTSGEVEEIEYRFAALEPYLVF